MNVIFVSESKKSAIKSTNKILDAFAQRVGQNTWLTPITKEGLDGVKRALSRTASKATAVACHKISSRQTTELVWIVGQKNVFSEQGFYPTNKTAKGTLETDSTNWSLTPVMQSLAASAGLFHDIGKANDYFQNKLIKKAAIADPIRHEWLSCQLLSLFFEKCANALDLTKTLNSSKKILSQLTNNNLDSLPANLNTVSNAVLWLILTHHRMPSCLKDKDRYKTDARDSVNSIFKSIKKTWGYSHVSKETDFKKGLNFKKGLPFTSEFILLAQKWLPRVHSQAEILKGLSPAAFRMLLICSRFCLIIADHYVSSLTSIPKASDLADKSTIWANTVSNTHEYNQTLAEHCIGVGRQAATVAYSLPRIIKSLEQEKVESPSFGHTNSSKKYKWQTRTEEKIKDYRKAGGLAPGDGCFTVVIASTGHGKTLANAKIMRALSEDGNSLRYNLVLGLRSLTLQTGQEYKRKINISDNDLAVVIGSKAVEELNAVDEIDNELIKEKVEFIYTDEFEYLNILFSKNKDTKKYKAMLAKPVLVSTIDYLMNATETVKGGRWLLPFLRLLSSDLVIDEIDDFSPEDLTAIARLIHMAGMCGRKVTISSATIPQDLSEMLYKAYKKGYKCHCDFHDGKEAKIACIWADEFSTKIITDELTDNIPKFSKANDAFVRNRAKKLNKKGSIRKGYIVGIPLDITPKNYYQKMFQEAVRLHENNRITYEGKRISFGLIRLANINPCIEAGMALLKAKLPEGYSVKVMIYHSRQTLLLRHEQEKYLDRVLHRQDDTYLNDPIIQSSIHKCQNENILFITISTPVEEVGRDHDFDWAVVEPSSYRSIIQLAGRVGRHREEHLTPKKCIAIMKYNLRGIKGEKIVFHRPGFESDKYLLKSHNVSDLITTKELENIHSAPRIVRPGWLNIQKGFTHLEHQIMYDLNHPDSSGPETTTGWNDGYWWMTALPQIFNRFRNGPEQIELILMPNYDFWDGENSESCNTKYGIEPYYIPADQASRLWLPRNYIAALSRLASPPNQQEELDICEENEDSLREKAIRYGTINIYALSSHPVHYYYSDQFGLYRINSKEVLNEYFN